MEKFCERLAKWLGVPYIKGMNRREFTRGLATLGLAPALPVAAGTASVAASASAERLYFVSWYTARLNTECSPETLVSELNIDKDLAREIFGKLIESNTVTPPDMLGISRTIDPLTDSYLRASTGALQKVSPPQTNPLSQSDASQTESFLSQASEEVSETEEADQISMTAESAPQVSETPQDEDDPGAVPDPDRAVG